MNVFVDAVAGGDHLDELGLQLKTQTGNGERAPAHRLAGLVFADQATFGAFGLQPVDLGRQGGVLVMSLELEMSKTSVSQPIVVFNSAKSYSILYLTRVMFNQFYNLPLK